MHEPGPEYRPPVAPPGLGYVPEGYQPAAGEPPVNGERPRRRLWLWLALGAVTIVALAAGTTAVILAGRWDGRPAEGDAAFTVRVSGRDGGPPAAAALEQTKQILLDRLRELKVVRSTVTAIGAGTLLVTAAPTDAGRAKSVLVPGNLTFRLVLANALDSAGGSCRPDQAEHTDRAAALASAKAKLGPTFAAAAAFKEPSDPGAADLTGFDTLTCAEVAALPPTMQYAVPGVTCAMLGARPAGSLDDPAAQSAACDGPDTKYLLDVAKVVGSDLATAEAKIAQETGTWIVNLHFTAAGQPRFTALSEEAIRAKAQNKPGLVAVLLDDTVVTAPEIQSAIPGDAVISGAWRNTPDEARALASTIGHGVLPTRLVIAAVETVR